MKLRSWIAAGLGVVLVISLLVNIFLARQLVARYQDQLIQQVWPAGMFRPDTTPQPANDSQSTILFLGDSRIFEWKLPPSVLNFHTVNGGVPGATTAQLRLLAPDLIKRSHPAIVVIEAGINDLKLLGLRPRLASLVISEAATNLTGLVRLCTREGCKVLLLEVWPTGKPGLLRLPVWNRTIPQSVVELNRRLQELNAPSQGIRVVNLIAEAGLNSQSLAYRDALHFRPATYRRLDPALERTLKDWNAIRMQGATPGALRQ